MLEEDTDASDASSDEEDPVSSQIEVDSPSTMSTLESLVTPASQLGTLVQGRPLRECWSAEC